MTNSIPSPQQPPAKTPLDEIALIARAANPGPHHIYTHPRDDNNWKANAAFHEAITPQLVISLIEAIKAKPEPIAQPAKVPSPSQHLEASTFLRKLVENAFSWGKQDCNYLNPTHIEKFIEATRKGMLPKEAATWVANCPSPQQLRAATVEDYRAVLKQARDYITVLKGDEYTVAGHCIDQVLAMPNPAPSSHVKWPEFGSFGSATAIMDVIDERLRQQSVEGWSLESDDRYVDNELPRAAITYALGNIAYWPWDLSWWKPTDRRRDLVKAAALLIAEIERLDRALATEGKADVTNHGSNSDLHPEKITSGGDL